MSETVLVKYPRTPHLPWSPGLQNDDRVIEDLSVLENCDDVVVTEKMDGENTTLYADALHARSLDGRMHPSRGVMKSIWASVHHDIPEDMRICGEYLYAKHSIHYRSLSSYFQVFNAWRDRECLSWDETVEWCGLLGLSHVRILYRGPWDRTVLAELESGNSSSGEDTEGFVIRVAGQFGMADYGTHVAKWVRRDHVQTSEHWMSQKVIPNELA